MSAVKGFLLESGGHTAYLPTQERRPRFGHGSAQKDAEGVYLVINTNLTSAKGKKRKREMLKWDRLRTVRRLLKSTEFEDPEAENTDAKKVRKWRTAKCMYVPVSYAVEHWKIANSKAFFKSVVVCGTRTVCPVCNEKISAWDREEMQAGLAKVFAKGWNVYMVTYTIRHDKYMTAGDSLSKLITGVSNVKRGRKWQELKKRYGFEGSFTALENTFSFENGHHPHKHILEVSSRLLNDGEIKSMRDEIAGFYLRELERIGAQADYEISVDVKRGNDYAAEYVSKFGYEPKVKSFGVAYEMSNYSGKTKGADFGHYTMFQLVDLATQGNEQAGAAFLDYAEAFRRRAILTWSAGLRKKLDMPKEKKDSEKLKDESSEEPKIFALYQSGGAWRKVRERHFDVLDASLKMDFEHFRDYLKSEGIDVDSPFFEIRDDGFLCDFGAKP